MKYSVNEGIEKWETTYQHFFPSFSAIFPKDNQLEDKVWLENVLTQFPLFGISTAFKKFQTHEPLEDFEEKAIVNFANSFTTCTLNAATIADKTEDVDLKFLADKVIDIVRAVNIHHHTHTCRKYDTLCRFGFCKYPIWETLISRPTTIPEEQRQAKLAQYDKILKDVKNVITDQAALDEILSHYPNKSCESR